MLQEEKNETLTFYESIKIDNFIFFINPAKPD